jgi:hypothetical protein
LWGWTASHTCKNHNSGIPNILNYCAFLWCVYVHVCVYIYIYTYTCIYKIYTRNRETHKNLVSRIGPLAVGCRYMSDNVCHFISLPKPLRSRVNYKIFPVLLLNPEHGSRMFLRNIATLLCHNTMPQPSRPLCETNSMRTTWKI